MGERLVEIPFASQALLAAAQKTSDAANDRLREAIPNPSGIKVITLFDTANERLFRVSDTHTETTIESIVVGFNGNPSEIRPTLKLPSDEITPQNTRHLGVLESQNPQLTDDVVAIAAGIAEAGIITREQYDEFMVEASTRPPVPVQFSAPLRAAGRLIAESATAKLRRLNPLRA